MPLAPGVRLGPYEVLGLIGAGGMGEVYRARDTRLERTVALKILPPRLGQDPALRARFQREARAISALNHPHICTLHDVGEEQGQAFLVMEHLSGETLADRLKKGPLALPQALEAGIQIADALAAAHKQGIVHRDLKPGNVMLTATGVKLLDFGLAALRPHGEQCIVDNLTSTPTESVPLTGEGTILGTMPYMAPEQLEGRPVGARTDVWALGAILHEMVTGSRAFDGRSSASLVAAILEREPAPLSTSQPLAPPSLERVVKRCLAKSPDDRWDGAHDVADELRWVAQGGLAPAGTAPGPAAGRWRWALVVGGLALVAGAILGGLVGRRLLAPASPRPVVVRSLLDVGPAEEVNAGGRSTILVTPGGSRTALAWTTDGRSLVFVGRQGGVQRLFVRALDGEEARVLEGTEGAQMPTVSPDGRWVVFWANGAIRRVPLAGGPVAVVVEGVRDSPTGIACGENGRLFYDGAGETIWSAQPERPPTALTKRLDTEMAHVLPHFLPGGRALLYTVRHRFRTWGDEEVVAHVFATSERKVLLRDAADARYVASGHLVFLRRGTLFGVGFDLPRLEIDGTPIATTNAVTQALTSGRGWDMTGAGQFSVASTGSLAYVRGAVVPHLDFELVAIDRRGRVTPLGAPTRSYNPVLDLSPDGRYLAVVVESLTETGLWLYDRERGTLSKLTPGGEAMFPRWTPDGQHVAFWWLNQGVTQLAWQPADGTAGPEVLARDPGRPSSWSPNGRLLALGRLEGDIFIASLENGKAAVQPLVRTPEIEWWPEFSPDGRWLAYGSNTSGRYEVYVQPYPGPAPRQQVSLEGGESPAWSPTGRELFFLSLPDSEGLRQMMAVDVRTGRTLSLGKPQRLFAFSEPPLRLRCEPNRCYAVAPDGQQFYTVRQAPTAPIPPVTHIHLIQNWTEELKTRVPAGRTR